MNDFAKFLSINGLKRKDIASFLGVSGAFITQISSGDRKLPDDKLALIKANAYGWDISMLTTQSKGVKLDSTIDLLQGTQITEQTLRSAIEQAINPTEETLVSYLQRKIDDQDSLIRQLYQQIGMLEAKLDLIRKGEIVGNADGSSSANVG